MQNVKQKLAWLWENAEKILIVLFFLTFTLNIRKVFLTPYSFLNGGFNEYMTMSLSWADVLILGTIIIYNIKLLFSQLKKRSPTNSLLQNVIRNKSSVIRIYYEIIVSRETIWLLLFLIWAGLTVFWAFYKPTAYYRFFTLLEIVLFARISAKFLQNKKWLGVSLSALVLNGLFQSVLGIAQFVWNKSLGLHFLGESIIGPNIDGVAKILINGEKHIRAYGTFPHPNILAGFLIVPLFLLIAESILRFRKVSHETLLELFPAGLVYLVSFIIGLGFVLTFSRSTFLGLFVGLLLLLTFSFSVGWNQGRKETRNKFLPFLSGIVGIALVVFVFFFSISKHSSFFSSQSLQERGLYQNVSYETISSHPITGVGLGSFVFYEFVSHPNLEGWQYQPVHNIYLLIFSELGIVGFVLFVLFLGTTLLQPLAHNSVINPYYGYNYLTKTVLRCIIISFLIISFFDHYFWDIKIGTLIFVLPLIFSAKQKS